MAPGEVAGIVIGVLLFAALCGTVAWRYTALRSWVRRRVAAAATSSHAALTEARPVVVPESFTADDVRLRPSSSQSIAKAKKRERELWADRGGREREQSEVDDVVLAEASEMYTVTPTFRTMSELSRRKTNLYESDDDVIQAEVGPPRNVSVYVFN